MSSSARRIAARLEHVLGTQGRRLTWICYGFALAVGLTFMLSIVPSRLLIHGVVPNDLMSGDVAAHVVGQRAFLRDGWHWPLLWTTRLNWPIGLSIAMTDSNPLVALVLKLFRPVLPPGFAAIQLWLAFAYIMQAPAAIFALRSAGERRFVPAMTVSVLAISMPTFIYRYHHSALSSHFLLLLAIGAYFRVTRNLRGQILLPPILLLTSFLVHPYIAFMTLAILSAAPVSLALRRDTRWRRAALVVACSLVLVAVAASCLGYAATDPTIGFGYASMNLISPFYPVYGRLFGRQLTYVDPTGEQTEGYQYLGAGLLLLGLLTVVTALFSTRVLFLRRHVGIFLACLALTALALSNVVYLGTHKLLDLGPVPSFLQQLRGSGRLFWPVAYVMLVGAVATLARLLPISASWVVLPAAALAQLVDARDLRHAAERQMRTPMPMVLPRATLDTLMARHTHLTMLPIYGCGGDPRNSAFIELLLAASTHDVMINTMYVGRFGTLPACQDVADSARPLSPGELRVFLPSEASTGPALVPDTDKYCRAFGVVTLCTLQAEALRGMAPVSPPTLPLGQTMAANLPPGAAILGPGWDLPEPAGVWTVGNSATFVVTLPLPKASGLIFEAEMRGYTGDTAAAQHVGVSVNGHAPTGFDVPNRRKYAMRLTIPPDQLVAGPQILRFDVAHPVRPSEVHLASDARQLGVFLENLRFDLEPSLKK